MARVTSDGQTRASTTSLLMSRTSHLRDLRQTGCDVMSVLVSQEADVLLANLAYGHDKGILFSGAQVLGMLVFHMIVVCNGLGVA